jgi:hypothetical protein
MLIIVGIKNVTREEIKKFLLLFNILFFFSLLVFFVVNHLIKKIRDTINNTGDAININKLEIIFRIVKNTGGFGAQPP